ncbi:hypothetical protein M422DRAFT_773340 [Sphaerobolus stellatus SS14]|nr:hypothetical protein M422DRAFT_773340 [Sphaerobolus stellatus SS14]
MPLRPTCARVPNRALLSITGENAHQFLHGIISQGPSTPPRGSFFTAFLHAQGRVLADAFVYRTPTSEDKDDGYIIEYDARPSKAPPLVSILKRYVLRSKVKIRDVSDEWDVWAAWGISDKPDDRKWRWSRSGAVEPVWETKEWPWGGVQNHFSILDRRAYGMGHRRVVRQGDPSPDASECEVTPEEAYVRHRIMHGVPEGIEDIQPMQAFPMESNLDIMGAIDFRKGCYVGQELTVRTYHTGVVRKRIFPIELQPLDPAKKNLPPLSPGLHIFPTVKARDEQGALTSRPGKLLTTVGNVGLALLRLEHIQAVTRGAATFELPVKGEESVTETCQVNLIRPIGWPQPGVNEVDS